MISRVRMTPLGWGYCGLGFLLLALIPLSAQEKTASETEATTPPVVEKAEAEPAEDTPEKPIADEDLEKALNPEEKDPVAEKVGEISQRMLDVQKLLNERKTAAETREIQGQIVSEIDELLKQLKQPPPPSSSSQDQQQQQQQQNQQQKNQQGQQKNQKNKSSSQNRKNRGQRQQNQPQQGNQGGAGQQQQQQQQTQSQATQSSKAKDSNTQTGRDPRQAAAEEALRARLSKDVWGHLPPAVREQLLNVYGEKYLPKYDELVRKYYEALAEQNRSGNR